jgi:hypothetical protein
LDKGREVQDTETSEGDRESEEASSAPLEAELPTSTSLEKEKVPV